MMGSGGAIVMDEDNCMVDVAKFYMEFICDESCGKCSPCRIGTKRMLELLTKITKGTATMEDLDKLMDLANYIKTTLSARSVKPRPTRFSPRSLTSETNTWLTSWTKSAPRTFARAL